MIQKIGTYVEDNKSIILSLLNELPDLNENKISLQENGFDCGLFACMYIKCMYFEEEFSFDQSFVNKLRRVSPGIFCDCGLFACMYIKCIYFEEDFSFDQSFVNKLREFLRESFVQCDKVLKFDEDIWKTQMSCKEIFLD